MISSPDLAASRSRLADWLEGCALITSHGAGQANLARLVRLASDEHREREADIEGVVVEDESVDPTLEETLDRVAEEIGAREQALDDEYPFKVTRRPFRLKLRAEFGALTTPHWMYLFLLLISSSWRGRASLTCSLLNAESLFALAVAFSKANSRKA